MTQQEVELELRRVAASLRFLQQANRELLDTVARLTLAAPGEVTIDQAAGLTVLRSEVPLVIEQSLDSVERLATVVARQLEAA